MELDLVDEMQWEDVVDFLTLEQAGIEEKVYDNVNGALKEYFDGEA